MNITQSEWGYLIQSPEQMSDVESQMVLEIISRGLLVVAEVTKKTINKNAIVTVQDRTDIDEKLAGAIEFVLRLYRAGQIYDFNYRTPPTGFLASVDSHNKIVVTDGNHRTATAMYFDIPIGIRLTHRDTNERVRPFTGILSPISRELARIDS